MPDVFWIVPEKAPPAPPLPTVKVSDPPAETLLIVPAPLTAPTVGLNPFRLSVPAFTARAAVLSPSAALLPNSNTPPLTVVPPV